MSMYRIDVFGKNTKPNHKNNVKLGSHWYPTLEQAQTAKYAIENMPRKLYELVPGENRKKVKVALGGYTVSQPILDNKF